MNTTTAIRFNAFARSCNDDYSPVMEELCVKMSMLSLQADPKMEAYDAEMEQSFCEEKVDNARDDQNEETFNYNDETKYSFEVCVFNTRYSTDFTTKQLVIFLDYVEHTGLTIEDAFEYSQSCHSCGNQLREFCGEFCNRRCAEYIECDLSECIRGDNCLICAGYPEVQTTCYWAKNGCDKCDAYDGPEEERYPYECFYCLTQMTDHEGYDIDNELYCNNCAVELFDKTGHLEDQDNDDQDNDDQDNNDSRKRDRDSEDDDESEGKRQCVNEKNTRDMMSKLTDESCDIWELALDINNGDKQSALKMIEDQPRLRAHPRIIEYYLAKETSNDDMNFEECSSECSSFDEDLQQRKRARVSDEELDISDVDYEDFVIDLVSDEEEESEDFEEINSSSAAGGGPVCVEVESYDGLSNNKDRNWVFTRFIDRNEDEEEDNNFDYSESVVDDDSEENEVPNQHLYNAMLQMEEENAALRHELHVMRTQRHMLFPEGSSISITIECGQRYINIHDVIPLANNNSMTLDELDGDDDESSCEEEEDNMDWIDMNESV